MLGGENFMLDEEEENARRGVILKSTNARRGEIKSISFYVIWRRTFILKRFLYKLLVCATRNFICMAVNVFLCVTEQSLLSLLPILRCWTTSNICVNAFHVLFDDMIYRVEDTSHHIWEHSLIGRMFSYWVCYSLAARITYYWINLWYWG